MLQQIKTTLRPYIRPYQRMYRTGKKDLKKLLLLPLRLSPISSEKMGPPKGLYRSLEAWKQATTTPGADFVQIAEVQPLERPVPATIEPEVHWLIKKEFFRESIPAYVATIPHGRVWVKHNNLKQVDSIAILSEDDKLIDPLSYQFKVNGFRHAVFGEAKLGPVHHLEGKALCLASMKGEMFFHWILEVLPRIGSLERAGLSLEEMDHVIVNSGKSRFMKDTLAMVGVPLEKLVDMQEHPHIKASELVVPSMPAGTGNYTPWVLEWLHERLSPGMATLDESVSPFVYISRAKAQFRNVTNEPEVIDLLSRYGFQAHQLETMSYAEQTTLFAQAKVIVAPHGAGLTHLFFCEPGTQIIEFYDPMYINACFYSLANASQLSYSYFLGEGKGMKEGVNLELNEGNITVSIEKLEKMLELAEVKPLEPTGRVS
ncbi:MAG: glycosyltransferase family 61 protein [Bacteroidia bacterium]|nr:glycosyltransferase family 61 protein [Bacteroidia bacterium]